MISDTDPIEATLFELAVDLNGESTEREAIDRTVAAIRGVLEDTAVTLWRRQDRRKNGSNNGPSTDRSASAPSLICERQMGRPARTPPPDAPLVERCITAEAPIRTDGMAGPRPSDDTHWLPRTELFVSIGSDRVLSAGWDHEEVAALDEATVCDVLDRAGVALAAALDRISAQRRRDLPSNTASEIRLGELRQAIEDAADGVAVLDDETYVYVDQTHVDMYGFDSKQQLLGQSWRALYAADEVARIEAEAFDVLDRDGHWQGQVTGSRPDGTTFPAELSLTMVGPSRMVCTVRDVTVRSERVQWASTLFDQGPLQFVQTRAVDGEAIVETCDRSFCEALGYEVETVIGQPLSEFYDAPSADSLQSDGYDRALSGDLTVTKRTLVTADGDTIPCLLRAIPRTVDDTVVGTDVVFIDISERKKYVRRLEAVFNSSYQVTALLRPSGTVTDVNDSLVARSGVDRSAMVGEPFEQFRWLRLDGDTELTVSEAVTRAADGTFVRSEAELQGRDGLVRLDVSFKPIRNAAGDITLIAVEGNDITVKTRQRQHLQVLQRVVRHNIRNDLNKLVGWTTILAEEPDPDRRQEHLNRLTRILDGWERITDKMQVIDRALREIPCDESAADIGAVTETAIATAQDEHPDATIAVSIDAPDVTVSRWVVHPLTEVMKNAVAAGDRGDPHVDVSVRREKDGWLQIVVADDGPGMPEIERGALVTGEETALQHGSGVGIWLTRMVTSVLGGEVAVDVTDLGTEVTLQVPTAAGPHGTERIPSEQIL